MTLSVLPGVPAAPIDLLREVVPVVPTTERDFARQERVTAFARVYQGGKEKDPLTPVTLVVRVLDGQGATAFERTDELGADRFPAARASDQTIPLPLARLSAGQYLLTISASVGKVTARRDLRFSVR